MAKIYNDFASANLMSFAKSFARLNGQPLDKSEIWYSLAEAQEYAATDAAYVGQTLAVIDSENKNVVFYGIQDAEGTLKEVGSAPVGDNLSVEIVDGKVQLKNFGKEYYAYVPAVKDEEGNITEESKYVLTEGFKAGLEPRVIVDGENLVIAWYEPGSETVEDVAANVESVSKVVDELDEVLNAEGGLVDQVDELKDQVGNAADDMGNAATGLYKELEDLTNVVAGKADASDLEKLAETVDEKANAADVYTKEEAENKIAAAIANAPHLKRVVVNAVADIEVEADDALEFIYMVPTGLQEDDDKYDEYMVIEFLGTDDSTGEEVIIRQVERVGSWEIDLSQYAKVKDLQDLAKTVAENKEAAENAISAVEDALADEVERAEAAEKANANAIAAEKERAEAAEKANADAIAAEKERAELAEQGLAEDLADMDAAKANKTDVYTKEEVYTKSETVTEILAQIDKVNENVGESAGAVLSKLEAYQKVVNTEVWGNEAGSGDENGNSRIDNLETQVTALKNAKPFISNVSDDFQVIDGTLNLKELSVSKIEGLQDMSDNLTIVQKQVGSLEDILNGYVNEETQELVPGLVAEVQAIKTDYLTLVDFNAAVGNLEALLAANTTIVDRLETIEEVLKWQEMPGV